MLICKSVIREIEKEWLSGWEDLAAKFSIGLKILPIRIDFQMTTDKIQITLGE